KRGDDATLRGTHCQPVDRALDGPEGQQTDVGDGAVLLHGLGHCGRTRPSHSPTARTARTGCRQKTLIVGRGLNTPSTASADGARRLRSPLAQPAQIEAAPRKSGIEFLNSK